MKTVRIETLGCRLNQIESEAIARLFIEKGFNIAAESLNANVEVDVNTFLIIINTCAVTQKAEQKARRIFRLCLKKFPNAVLLVTGCYAQLSKSEIENIDSRIVVLGGQVKSRIKALPDLMIENQNYEKKAAELCDLINKAFDFPVEKPGSPEDSFSLSTSSFLTHSRASLKIQDGCNNNCSFCAIHIARGHSVSIPAETAIQRVIELEKTGQSEIVLTTVNIAQYKSEYNGNSINFSGLLRLLLQNTKNICFRISSLYPEIVDDDFCDVIKDSRVRPHFHISVQSGSDKILSLMNRRYTASQVEQACARLRKAKENPFIACDIITGFPAETDEDFNLTMDLCKACNFSWVHAFPFSERKGTDACKLKPKIPQSVSGERSKIITDWAIEQKINYINSYVGKPLDLILEVSRNKDSPLYENGEYLYHGMTENFIHCDLRSKVLYKNSTCVKVKIVKPLPQKIKKGGEIEAQAQIIQ